MKNPIIPGLVFLAASVVSIAQPDKKMVDDVLTTKKLLPILRRKKTGNRVERFHLI